MMPQNYERAKTTAIRIKKRKAKRKSERANRKAGRK